MTYRKLFIYFGIFSHLIASTSPNSPVPAQQDDAVPFTIMGGYELNEARIQQLNGTALKMNRYGTTTLLQAKNPGDNPSAPPKPIIDPITQNPIIIRDQHYPLYNFANKPLTTWVKDKTDREVLGYGIRILPAVSGFTGSGTPYNQNTASNKNGETARINGSNVVDNYLRRIIYGSDLPKGGKPGDMPIFVQIAYMHPEGYQGEPFDLAGEPGLKTEMGFTHKGLYLGNGKSVNSPPGYHDDSWWSVEDTNYPALVTVMDYAGLVDANGKYNYKALAQNGTFTAFILNEAKGEVDIFPRETSYKFDYLYSNNLEKTFDFYARWLEDDPIFDVSDPTDPRYAEAQWYKSYCAEHATEIQNVFINLPQNIEGYKTVFGATQGPVLFERAMDKIYHQQLRSGEDAQWVRNAYMGEEETFRSQSEKTVITPLWSLLGKKHDPDHPLVTKGIDGKYHAADPDYLIPGYSLVWKPETVGDLLKDFVREYLTWTRVGSLTTIPAILGFANEAKLRMNVDIPQYVTTIKPVIQQILLHEAAMKTGIHMLEGITDEETLFSKFKTERSATINGTFAADGTTLIKPGLNLTMQGLARKMQDTIYSNGKERPDPIVMDKQLTDDVLKVANGFESLIAGQGTSSEDLGWQNVYKLAVSSISSLKQSQDFPDKNEASFRKFIYANIFVPTVKPMLDQINTIDPNYAKGPDGKDVMVVKYYYAPAVHVRVALGIHDADSQVRQFLRLWPVGHVMRAEEVEPLPGNANLMIDDSKTLNLNVIL